MILDKVYNEDCLDTMARMDDNSVDLIIADPPYFKVVNQKWDYEWRTLEEYLSWCRKWFEECFRVLRKGGSLYCYGYFKTLAHQLSILEDIGFATRQLITIDKGKRALGGRATKNYQMFPNTTENLLFLVKDSHPFTKSFLKERQKKLGLKSKEINELMGMKSNGGGMWSIYTGNNVSKQVPTEEMWNKLSKILEFDIPYSNIGITFNIEMGITDVWDDIDFYKEKRQHPTQKPLVLSNRIIQASSNEGDLVYVPFAGSGSEIIGAMLNNRKWIASEINKEYVDDIIKPRISETNK